MIVPGKMKAFDKKLKQTAEIFRMSNVSRKNETIHIWFGLCHINIKNYRLHGLTTCKQKTLNTLKMIDGAYIFHNDFYNDLNGDLWPWPSNVQV